MLPVTRARCGPITRITHYSRRFNACRRSDILDSSSWLVELATQHIENMDTRENYLKPAQQWALTQLAMNTTSSHVLYVLDTVRR